MINNQRASQNILKRYIKNTSWMLVEQGLRIISGLFVGFWVARYLGPEDFGVLSYVVAFVALFQGISKLGLDSVVLRELIDKPYDTEYYLGTAFWLRVCGAFIAIVFVLILVLLKSPDSEVGLYILIISLGMIFQGFDVVEFLFQSKVLAKYISICKIVQLFFSMCLKVVLVLVEADIVWFVYASVVDCFVLAILFFRINEVDFYKRFNLKFAKGLLNDSWPLMLAGLGFTLFSNVDLIMIKYYLGAESVGLYSAAYKLTVMWYFLPGLILNSIMTAVVSVKDDFFVYRKRIHLITGLIVWFSIILALFVSFFSEEIITYTYGKQYVLSSDLLVFLIWINVIVFFNSCWNRWHMIENRSRFVMYFHLFTALLNVILNFFFIPEYGAIGAAYAILLALISSLVLFSFLDLKTAPLFFNSLVLGWKAK